MSLGGPRFALLWVARKVVGNEGMKLYTGYDGDETSRNLPTFRASQWLGHVGTDSIPGQ